MGEYLKIPEVARRLDISEKTARRYIRSGELPSAFIGGAYRVSEEDLASYQKGAIVKPEELTARPFGSAPLPFEEAPFPFDATAVAREAVEEAGAETEEEVFRVIDAAYSRALEGWSREDLQAMYERANQAALRELSGPQRGTWEELERKQREWRESDSYRRYREASAERYAISAALAALDRAEASDLVPA